jgi:hypothetical protein
VEVAGRTGFLYDGGDIAALELAYEKVHDPARRIALINVEPDHVVTKFHREGPARTRRFWDRHAARREIGFIDQQRVAAWLRNRERELFDHFGIDRVDVCHFAPSITRAAETAAGGIALLAILR